MRGVLTVALVAAWAAAGWAEGVFRVEAPFFEHDWQIGPWRNFTNATELIQGAIDDAFRAGGGTVRVAKGSYPIRGLRLRSGVTLYLESGAALLASRDSADFRILEKDAVEPWDAAFEASKMVWQPPVRPFIRDAGNPWNDAIIRIHNAHDVAIVGEPGSVIDGLNGFNPDGEEKYRGVHGVTAFDSTNILYRGFTVRHTGNWALRHQRCAKIRCSNVRMLAGHDGFHIRECSDATVEDCVIHTGDDSIAGYANRNVVVRRCDLSSACSTFRFGGTDVLIEDVYAHGPCEYVFRGSLSPQLKRDGAWDPDVVTGRHSMSAFFRYFCDVTSPVPDQPGNIVVRNCRVENVGRLFKYNLGAETWQQGRRLADLRFERIVARGVELPIALNASDDESRGPRLSFGLKDCDIGFAGPQPEIFSAVAVRELKLENVRIWGAGADVPLVRAWGDRPELSAVGVDGAAVRVAEGAGKYKCIR